MGGKCGRALASRRRRCGYRECGRASRNRCPLATGTSSSQPFQTLNAKITTKSYEFLADFRLIVFDEAHRSVAPTYTSVMQELGLTRWQRATEPHLLGLTATPYRGYSVEETAWLVRRYSSNRLDAGAFASEQP